MGGCPSNTMSRRIGRTGSCCARVTRVCKMRLGSFVAACLGVARSGFGRGVRRSTGRTIRLRRTMGLVTGGRGLRPSSGRCRRKVRRCTSGTKTSLSACGRRIKRSILGSTVLHSGMLSCLMSGYMRMRRSSGGWEKVGRRRGRSWGKR